MTGPLGISFASRAGHPPAELGALAAAAERAGFAAVLLAEGSSDVLALCPAVLAATERVRVGTAIANAHLHPPHLTAMTAATLADLAGGRFVRATFLGHYEGLPEASQTLYARLIPAGGYRLREGVCFEEYVTPHDAGAPEDMRTDLYAPIV